MRPAAAHSDASVRDVLVALTSADLHVRFGRGKSQFVKWLLDPFALVGVYLLFVSFVLPRSTHTHAVGLSLACAVVPFQLVMMSVTSGMNAITGRRSIVLNMRFKRVLIPISTVLSETVAFAGSFVLLALMMGAYGVAPTTATLWFPVVVLVSVVSGFGIAYPASLFGLWFPELRNFAVSIVRALFFVAPGLVALPQIHGGAHTIFQLNPLTGLFESYRAVLLYGHRPSALHLLYPLAWAAVLLAIFVPLYTREQWQFAKVVE
ncbi:MAG: lipopolysaccharide transport system permease protein [Gaiellaceae bacterium]|nr:lipopolysaccharide transport system permease protein [Gaiellaceae bacterium]